MTEISSKQCFSLKSTISWIRQPSACSGFIVAIATAMASVGGKLHFFGFTHGKWDAIVAGEAPSEVAFMSVIASAWMAGMIQDVETIPCIAQETVTEVMSKAGNVNYKGPGQ